jgi:WD40 repeat protein
VYFLDPASGALLRSFRQHDLCGGDISVSADGRYLATTSDDASVRIWKLGPAE